MTKVCRLDFLGVLGHCNSKQGLSCRSCSWYVEESEARLVKKIRDEEDQTRVNFLNGLKTRRRRKG